jgi:hypothetical protein
MARERLKKAIFFEDFDLPYEQINKISPIKSFIMKNIYKWINITQNIHAGLVLQPLGKQKMTER